MSLRLPDYFWLSETNGSAKVVKGKYCSALRQRGCIEDASNDQITCLQNLRDTSEIKCKGAFFIPLLCGEGERCEEFGACYRGGREQGLNQRRSHMLHVLSESGSNRNYTGAAAPLVMSGYTVGQYRTGRQWAKMTCCPECPTQERQHFAIPVSAVLAGVG